MKHSYTENDLVLYLYNEMSEKEQAALEVALQQDFALHNQLLTLQEGKDLLPKLSYRPSLSCVQAILRASTQQAVEAQC